VGCIDFSKKKPSINCNNNYLFLFGYDINSPGWRRRGPLFHSPAGGRIRHVSIKTNHHHLSIFLRFLRFLRPPYLKSITIWPLTKERGRNESWKLNVSYFVAPHKFKSFSMLATKWKDREWLDNLCRRAAALITLFLETTWAVTVLLQVCLRYYHQVFKEKITSALGRSVH
jgi:hypothetical protein